MITSLFKHGTGPEKQFVDSAFRRFFVPALFSNLGLALGSMVDSLVVGNKLGQNGLSAIALGIPVYMFYNVLSYGFSIGGSIRYAALMGNGDKQAANRLFSNVFTFLLLVYLVTVGLGLFFLPQLLQCLGISPAHAGLYAIARRYVRAQLICVPILFCQGPLYFFVHSDGAPKRAAVGLTVSSAVDIVLNYVFVIRLNMGAEGSVWSTAAGALFCVAICGSHIIKKRGMLRFTGFVLEFAKLRRAIGSGFASAIQYLYQFVAILLMNNLLLRLGGVAAVAAFDILYALSTLAVAVADAIGMAVQPMVSTYLAERDEAAVYRTLKLALWYGSALSLPVIALLTFGAEGLGRFFGLSGDALTIAVNALPLYCLSILPACWNQIAINYRQTTECGISALIIQTLRLLAFFLPALYLLSQSGLVALWWAYVLAELGALLFVIFTHQSSAALLPAIIGTYSDHISSAEMLGKVVEQLQNTCESWGFGAQQSYFATLVVEELCAAILEDAGQNHRHDILIKLTVVADRDGFSLHLRDNSLAFNPFSDENGPNALGMSIVRKKAKEFFYRRYQGFNTLVVVL